MSDVLLEPATTVSELVLKVEPLVNEFPSAAATPNDAVVDKVLKPNAATATSATRLKVVFVDICFLSISRLSDDPSAGFG
jgi:hypothetical protein